MKYILVLFFLCSYAAKAQVIPSGKNVEAYFVYIEGVNTKADVLSIEKMIKGKPAVLYFMAQDFPVKYFLLKASSPVSKSNFMQWLSGPYTIGYFGRENDIERERYLNKKRIANQQN